MAGEVQRLSERNLPELDAVEIRAGVDSDLFRAMALAAHVGMGSRREMALVLGTQRMTDTGNAVEIDDGGLITLDDITRLAALVKRKQLHPIKLYDGTEGFLVYANDGMIHRVRVEQARADWKDYHRAVRVLRRLRLSDNAQYRRMSKVWWQTALKEEVTLDIRERERVSRILRAEKARVNTGEVK